MRSDAPETFRAFATFRVVGDKLVPDEVTEILKTRPTAAYAKGETYKGGKSDRTYVGKTGVWFLSTDTIVKSDSLDDHLKYLLRLFSSSRLEDWMAFQVDESSILVQFRQLLKQRSLQATVTCFWHGQAGAKVPKIAEAVAEYIRRLPATLECDFDADDSEEVKAELSH